MTKREEQTTQWPKEKNKQHNDQKRRTNNTMAKREEQTTQWPKEKNKQHNDQKKKGQREKLRSKHTHKTKDRVTRTPLKTRGQLNIINFKTVIVKG
jgi:hypothetical protein